MLQLKADISEMENELQPKIQEQNNLMEKFEQSQCEEYEGEGVFNGELIELDNRTTSLGDQVFYIICVQYTYI